VTCQMVAEFEPTSGLCGRVGFRASVRVLPAQRPIDTVKNSVEEVIANKAGSSLPRTR